MVKIAFVTDSTAYLPDPIVRKYNISVVPQVLVWGEQTYRDGVDIAPDEFYARLKTAGSMPTTSQVSIITMERIFQGLIEEGFDVLGVFVSENLSGTMYTACQGREALGPAAGKVTIIDSRTTSMAMGFQILAAARIAEDGACVEDCLRLIEKAREHVGVYFAVDTLEFLYRGGRIDGAQRFIGSTLNLKPIFTIRDGRVEAEDRVRTMHKAMDRMLDLVSSHDRDSTPVHIATLHANAEQDARDLLLKANERFSPIESLISAVSPVVGTHAGPGTVGLPFMEGI